MRLASSSSSGLAMSTTVTAAHRFRPCRAGEPRPMEPVDAVPAAELLAAQPPVLERPGALAEIRGRIPSHGRLLVIDDDPTGTQSVHGVPVLTAWSREALAGALADAGTVFVLTN